MPKKNDGSNPLKVLRAKHRLSQREMAVILDIPPNGLAQIENGHRKLSSRNFFLLVELFDLDPDEFAKKLEIFAAEEKRRILSKIGKARQ